RSFYYCWLYTGASASLSREPDGMELTAPNTNRSRNSTIDSYSNLHRLPLCPGKGTRHVAKPAVTTAPFCAGDAARLRYLVASLRLHQCNDGSFTADRSAAHVATRSFELASRPDDLGRSFFNAPNGARTPGNLGDGKWSL